MASTDEPLVPLDPPVCLRCAGITVIERLWNSGHGGNPAHRRLSLTA